MPEFVTPVGPHKRPRFGTAAVPASGSTLLTAVASQGWKDACGVACLNTAFGGANGAFDFSDALAKNGSSWAAGWLAVPVEGRGS